MNELSRVATREVVYEVESVIDPAVLADFDAWLPGHVRQVIACRGFIGAEIQSPRVAPGESPRRRVQYRLESAAALDHYIENDAPRLRADSARFGDRVRFERRVFEKQDGLLPDSRVPARCTDCGAPVTASYCAACGQAGGTHVMSLGEVFEDVAHSLLHVDSRVWRTLRALVLKPGQLTNEFIAGRRQRYLPPFRLYLVISLLFFGLKALIPDDVALHVGSRGAEIMAPATSTTPQMAATAGGSAPTDRDQAARELATVAADPNVPPAVAGIAKVAADGIQPGTTGGPGSCRIDLDLPGLRWLGPLIEQACAKLDADGGKRLGEVFLHNAPRLMFIFLPLIAAVALLFYWRPRRLYAEHLVFFLHTHAFLFLGLSLDQLCDAAVSRAPLLEAPVGVAMFALALYQLYYPYRAMRVVYRDGRARTLAKFALLSVAYFVLLSATLAAGLVYSVLTL